MNKLFPIFAAALLGGMLALAATAGDPGAAAVARMRLHDQVGWPEHDAVRLEVASWIDGDLIDSTNEFVGGSLDSVSTELPRNQSFFDVRATADNDQDALAAVDFVVDHLTARDAEQTFATPLATLAAAQQSLAETEAALAAITPAADDGDTDALNTKGALIWRVQELLGDVDDAQRDLDRREARIQRIGVSEISDGQRYRRLRIIAAASLVSAIGAGAVLTLLAGRTQPASTLAAADDFEEEKEEEE